jgi:hypothetical protein
MTSISGSEPEIANDPESESGADHQAESAGDTVPAEGAR